MAPDLLEIVRQVERRAFDMRGEGHCEMFATRPEAHALLALHHGWLQDGPSGETTQLRTFTGMRLLLLDYELPADPRMAYVPRAWQFPPY